MATLETVHSNDNIMRNVLVILFLFCVFEIEAKSPERISRYRDECLKELGLNSTVPARTLQNVQSRNQTIFEPTKEMKCMRRCMLEKAGFIDASGEIDLKKFHTPSSVNVSNCTHFKIEDKCELVYQTEKCLYALRRYSKPSIIHRPFMDIYQHRNNCIQELKLDPSKLSNFTTGRPPPSGSPTPNPQSARPGGPEKIRWEPTHETKCLQRCMLQKAAYVTKDDKLEKTKWNFGGKLNIDNCTSLRNPDKCEEIFLIQNCVAQQARKNFQRRGPPPRAFPRISEIVQHRNSCVSDLKLDFEKFGVLRSRPSSSSGKLEDLEPSHDEKCFRRCLLQKAGYLNADNKILAEKWRTSKDVDVSKCEAIKSDDKCEQAFLVERCLASQSRAKWRDQRLESNRVETVK